MEIFRAHWLPTITVWMDIVIVKHALLRFGAGQYHYWDRCEIGVRSYLNQYLGALHARQYQVGTR